jgi:hypothetical protein
MRPNSVYELSGMAAPDSLNADYVEGYGTLNAAMPVRLMQMGARQFLTAARISG